MRVPLVRASPVAVLPAVLVHAEGHGPVGGPEARRDAAAVGSGVWSVAAAAVVLAHRLLQHVRVDEILRVEPLAVRRLAPKALPRVETQVPARASRGAVGRAVRAAPNHRSVGVVVAPAIQRDAAARALLRAPVRRRGGQRGRGLGAVPHRAPSAECLVPERVRIVAARRVIAGAAVGVPEEPFPSPGRRGIRRVRAPLVAQLREELAAAAGDFRGCDVVRVHDAHTSLLARRFVARERVSRGPLLFGPSCATKLAFFT